MQYYSNNIEYKPTNSSSNIMDQMKTLQDDKDKALQYKDYSMWRDINDKDKYKSTVELFIPVYVPTMSQKIYEPKTKSTNKMIDSSEQKPADKVMIDSSKNDNDSIKQSTETISTHIHKEVKNDNDEDDNDNDEDDNDTESETDLDTSNDETKRNDDIYMSTIDVDCHSCLNRHRSGKSTNDDNENRLQNRKRKYDSLENKLKYDSSENKVNMTRTEARMRNNIIKITNQTNKAIESMKEIINIAKNITNILNERGNNIKKTLNDIEQTISEKQRINFIRKTKK